MPAQGTIGTMKTVDPGGPRLWTTARRGVHLLSSGASAHVGILGALVVAATVVGVAVTGSVVVGKSSGALVVPRAAAVAPHLVPAPVTGSDAHTTTVTVVAPLRKVDVFNEPSRDGQSGASAPAGGSSQDSASGTGEGTSDGAPALTDTEGQPSSTTTPGSGTATKPPTSTTTTRPGQSDDGGSDDGNEADHGTTTTTTLRSGGSVASNTSTTADK